MPFEIHIALRYLLARRKQAFISLISLISTLGVAVGVMALIVALALMTGLQGELRDRILGSTAHIYVMKPGSFGDYRAEASKLSQLPRVLGAAPAILDKALVSSERDQTFITLKGIDPALETSVTDIARAMQHGRVTDLTAGGEDALPGILIGKALAERLGVYVGDRVTVLTSQGTISPGGVIPRFRPFRVAGIFSLGLLEFDSEWGFISIEEAQRIFRRDIELIQLRVDDMWAAPEIARSIPDRLGSLYVAQDWQDMNQSLFSALWMEKVALGIAVGLIVIVAALQIIASLVLLVMEKSADIGILKTMGASAKSVTGIFMLQGLIIGIVGTSVGAASGVTLSALADRYRLVRVPMDVYQIEHVPFVVEPRSLALVVVLAIVICFLATIYPSRQAARLDPVEALRYG